LGCSATKKELQWEKDLQRRAIGLRGEKRVRKKPKARNREGVTAARPLSEDGLETNFKRRVREGGEARGGKIEKGREAGVALDS